MRKEYRQRLAKEYRYAVTKMQEVTQPPRKLFYFSVFFGEAQRILNWEWDTDLALIHMVTQQVYTQIHTAAQNPALVQAAPINWTMIHDKLGLVASDLANYFEKTDGNREELCLILGHLAEIGYGVSGNGSYLHEKGALKL